MRLIAAATLLAAALLLGDNGVDSFATRHPATRNSRRTSEDSAARRSCSIIRKATQTDETPCTVAEGNDAAIDGVTAQSIRSASVLNVDGERFELGDVMSKSGTSIVVFLRHMG